MHGHSTLAVQQLRNAVKALHCYTATTAVAVAATATISISALTAAMTDLAHYYYTTA
jgi:hypothetical protein